GPRSPPRTASRCSSRCRSPPPVVSRSRRSAPPPVRRATPSTCPACRCSVTSPTQPGRRSPLRSEPGGRGRLVLRPQGDELGDELRGVQVLRLDLGAEPEPRDDQPGRGDDVEPLAVVAVGPVGV